jgi:site-specific recombinase XerD
MFSIQRTDDLRAALARAHYTLAQHDLEPSERSITARNYDTAIGQLIKYLQHIGEPLPTRSALERWRDDMRAGRAPVKHRMTGEVSYPEFSVKSVNSKLAAARKLLRAVAADSTDIQTKLVLADWANVADAKAVKVQDKTETDYGRRLTLDSLAALVNSIPLDRDKGYRDRALIAVMGGAGLRVSEAVALTVGDVFNTTNEAGQRGIKVKHGKHHKSRVVVLNSWNSWVLDAVQAYTDRLGLYPIKHPNAPIFRGVDPWGNDTGAQLSTRGGQRAAEAYQAEYMGQMVNITAHDLRRTYAKLCKQSGMSWEALRENLGHASVLTTENYVGKDVDWSERQPLWSIKLRES